MRHLTEIIAVVVTGVFVLSGSGGAAQGASFTASPRSGPAPLTVSFSAADLTSDQYSRGQFSIDYGDGENSGPLYATCLSAQPYPGYSGPSHTCSLGAKHTYGARGTYTALLEPYIACRHSGETRCMMPIQTLGRVTITVR